MRARLLGLRAAGRLDGASPKPGLQGQHSAACGVQGGPGWVFCAAARIGPRRSAATAPRWCTATCGAGRAAPAGATPHLNQASHPTTRVICSPPALGSGASLFGHRPKGRGAPAPPARRAATQEPHASAAWSIGPQGRPNDRLGAAECAYAQAARVQVGGAGRSEGRRARGGWASALSGERRSPHHGDARSSLKTACDRLAGFPPHPWRGPADVATASPPELPRPGMQLSAALSRADQRPRWPWLILRLG